MKLEFSFIVFILRNLKLDSADSNKLIPNFEEFKKSLILLKNHRLSLDTKLFFNTLLVQNAYIVLNMVWGTPTDNKINVVIPYQKKNLKNSFKHGMGYTNW